MAKNKSNRSHSSDSLRQYLSELRRYPVLSREEELQLALKLRDGTEEEAKRAEAMLVKSNLRLVVKVANEYQSQRLQQADLIQEGNVGLLHAIRKFDPDKSNRLASYAQWWIRAFMLKFIMDNHKLVKVGTTQYQRKLFYNLKSEKERLVRQGIVPTAYVLARSLDVRVSDVTEMETRLSGRENSLDAPLQDGEKGTLIDILPSEDAATDEVVANKQSAQNLKGWLSEFRQTLEGRDVNIWEDRMLSENPKTLQQIGDDFGVSRERARQLEARILRNLSKFLNSRVKDPSEYDSPLGL